MQFSETTEQFNQIGETYLPMAEQLDYIIQVINPMLKKLESKFKYEIDLNNESVLTSFGNYRDEINRQMLDVQM